MPGMCGDETSVTIVGQPAHAGPGGGERGFAHVKPSCETYCRAERLAISKDGRKDPYPHGKFAALQGGADDRKWRLLYYVYLQWRDHRLDGHSCKRMVVPPDLLCTLKQCDKID